MNTCLYKTHSEAQMLLAKVARRSLLATSELVAGISPSEFCFDRHRYNQIWLFGDRGALPTIAIAESVHLNERTVLLADSS